MSEELFAHDAPEYAALYGLIDELEPHNHLCLIHESRREWAETIVPFIRSGLERNHKCIYVVDVHSAGEIKKILREDGLEEESMLYHNFITLLHQFRMLEKTCGAGQSDIILHRTLPPP